MDTLISIVNFVGPNKDFGGCVAPIQSRNDSKSCFDNITQDLTTNTTTLFLNETNKSMSGLWRCTHGTETGEDCLNITIPTVCNDYRKLEDSNWNTCCIILVVVIVVIVILVAVFMYCAYTKSLLSWIQERLNPPPDEHQEMDTELSNLSSAED